VPDARYGEEIAAFVIAREGAALDVDAVCEFRGGKIAHYKVPRYVLPVDEFPMTITGKVQKYQLRNGAIVRPGLGAAGNRISGDRPVIVASAAALTLTRRRSPRPRRRRAGRPRRHSCSIVLMATPLPDLATNMPPCSAARAGASFCNSWPTRSAPTRR
jgi:hypothetical protein